ncbi:MAG: Serine/threonine kinase [Myxococcales bacterium]|nr:Serine/threonine kinase [Myxococcales bacterium]
MAGGSAKGDAKGGEKSEDELARTATAPGSVSSQKPVTPIVGGSLGRFRLERELGAGGMGVVHAAFDPDLERRVALKVLRTVDGGKEAQERLLREAKAMARLDHPNVVVVHEVGSAGGRDYVAMELIDGETLADWLRVDRSEDEIVDAFIAAGRGLAAAHAAGLVHRDFKPHNVLRRRDGRIVVTDFGLARGVEIADKAAVALETTLRLPAAGSSATTPLGGLTRTGSVLGTPAYMAPEQWSGGVIGPPADQFAFCVALWEALAGERPYRGATIEALEQEVRRGPAELDASKLPRRLRRPLRRGLDPDPAKRWPSMDGLLAAISRKERRPGAAMMIAGGAIVSASLVYMLAFRGDQSPTCETPAHDPDAVWSPEIAATLRSHSADLADTIAEDITAWRTIRETACKAPAARRIAQLACLDGVMGRLDALVRAAPAVSAETSDVLSGELVEPKVCTSADLPKLTLAPTAETMRAFTYVAESTRDDKAAKPAEGEIRAFADQPNLDPCARSLALMALGAVATEVPKSRAAANDAVEAADQCGDDRLRADAITNDARYHFEPFLVGPKGLEAIRKAQTAIERVSQPDLVADLELLRSDVWAQQWRWQEAFDATARASSAYGARRQKRRQLMVEHVKNGLRLARGEVSDLEALRSSVARLRPLADAMHATKLVHDCDRVDAFAQYMLGDVAGGHAALERTYRPDPDVAPAPTHKVEGVVVDARGNPMAGATIVAAQVVFADSIGIPLHLGDRRIATATSDAAGHFTIPDGPLTGAVMAQFGPLRSLAVPVGEHVRAVLQPTRRLEGKVDLAGLPRKPALVIAEPLDVTADEFRLVAPVAPDGSFAIDGAPTGRLQVGVQVDESFSGGSVGFQLVEASQTATKGIKLKPQKTDRTLDVVVRSTVPVPLDTAQIIVLPGIHALTTVGDLIANVQRGGVQVDFARHLVGEQIPQALFDKVHSGDVVAHFKNTPAGELTACAIGLQGDLMDPAVLTKIQAHIAELQMKCERVGPNDPSIVVEAPPQKRFD